MKNLLLTAAACIGFAAASLGQTLPAYLPSDGLVGWWPFNGNANDESGNGNDGTVSGAVLTSDRFGNANSAYDFNPLSSTITTSLLGPTGRNPRSVSLWFSLDIENTSNDQWVMMGYGGNSVFEGFALSIWNNPNFGLSVDIGASYMVYGPCPIGSYHHLVATYDSSDGNTLQAVKMYLDGMLLGDVIENNGVFTINTGNFNNVRFGPGDSPISDLQTFKGSLDDIGIWNRALSQEEITALYTGEPVNPPTTCNPLPSNLQNGLVGYWPFCGNANDESGNGNDGTVNGAVLANDRFDNSGNSYSFEGNQTIIIPHNESLNLASNFSLSLWYNPTIVQDPAVDLLIKGPNDYIGRPYYLRHHGNTNEFQGLAFRHATGVFPAAPSIEVSSSLPSINEWHHIAISINDSLTSLYVDGLLKDTSLFTGLQGIQNNEALRIGGGYYQYNGRLDDIGIWNRALTADEVQQLYTLNACTFTVYDTTHVTVYDTVTTYTTVTDTLIINTLITELAPPANTNTIKVFPNPASTELTIDYGNFALMSGYQLRIENSLGQQVFQTNINQQSDTLSLATWGGNGLYFVHIVDPQGNTIDVRKIVLQ